MWNQSLVLHLHISARTCETGCNDDYCRVMCQNKAKKLDPSLKCIQEMMTIWRIGVVA